MVLVVVKKSITAALLARAIDEVNSVSSSRCPASAPARKNSSLMTTIAAGLNFCALPKSSPGRITGFGRPSAMESATASLATRVRVAAVGNTAAKLAKLSSKLMGAIVARYAATKLWVSGPQALSKPTSAAFAKPCTCELLLASMIARASSGRCAFAMAYAMPMKALARLSWPMIAKALLSAVCARLTCANCSRSMDHPSVGKRRLSARWEHWNMLGLKFSLCGNFPQSFDPFGNEVRITEIGNVLAQHVHNGVNRALPGRECCPSSATFVRCGVKRLFRNLCQHFGQSGRNGPKRSIFPLTRIAVEPGTRQLRVDHGAVSATTLPTMHDRQAVVNRAIELRGRDAQFHCGNLDRQRRHV